MTCVNQKTNQGACNCTYAGCSRHGVCCECLSYHRRQNELPACYFTAQEERTYDRSLRYFVQQHARK